MTRSGAKNAGSANSRKCARGPAGCSSETPRRAMASPSRRAACGKRAKCSKPSSSRIRNTSRSRRRSYRAYEYSARTRLAPLGPPRGRCKPAAAAGLVEQAREVIVVQAIQRVGAMPQRPKQARPIAECLGDMLGFQCAGLIERRDAAELRGEIVEVDQEVGPAVLAAR